MPPEEGVRAAAGPGDRPLFLADAMVAELARWLRILGEDCLWAPPSWSDTRVLEVAGEDARVLLTRDDRLVERARRDGVDCLRVPQATVEEVLVFVYRHTGLSPRAGRLATRCSLCNGPLCQVDGQVAHERALAAGKEPPMAKVRQRHDRFWSCTVCHQPFWRGTHWQQIERVRARLAENLD